MEQSSVKSEPTIPADIFDMEHRVEPPGGPEEQQAATPGISSGRTGSTLGERISKLTAVHLGGLTVIVLIAGLTWSHLSHRQRAQPAAGSELLAPGMVLLPDPTSSGGTIKPPATPVSQAHASRPGDAIPAAAQPQVAVDDPERIIIKAALEDLNTRLTLLEAHANTASSSSPVHGVTAARAAVPVTRTVTSSPRMKQASKATAHDGPPLDGYTLNTIYQGQAWIEHAGVTYAVQVGDKIGELSIVRIDPRTRHVTTSRGLIH
ncbi:MAG: hypothetical protein V4724_39780 [Pseudomonadota bacterium]